MKTKKQSGYLLKTIAVIAAVLMAFVLFSACAASSNSPRESTTGGESYGTGEALVLPGETTRKIVYTADIALESEDFDKTLEQIESEIARLSAQDKAYSGQSNIYYNSYNPSGSITVRVRTENFNEFIESISGYGQVRSRSFSSEDITARYNNAAAEIYALEKQLESLKAAIDTNIGNPDLVIMYSEQVSIINQRLSVIQKTLATYDDLVEFSTVNINIYSKGNVPVEVAYGTKIEQTFFGSLNALWEILKFLLLAIIAVAPFAAVGAVILVAVLKGKKLYYKLFPKRAAKRKALEKQQSSYSDGKLGDKSVENDSTGESNQ